MPPLCYALTDAKLKESHLTRGTAENDARTLAITKNIITKSYIFLLLIRGIEFKVINIDIIPKEG